MSKLGKKIKVASQPADPQTLVSMIVDIPLGLKEALREEGRQEKRSMRAQLEYILQERYKGATGSLAPPPRSQSTSSGAATTL